MPRYGATLYGDTALVSALAELGRSMGGPALDASMRKGANVLKPEIQSRWESSKGVNQTAAKTSGNVVGVQKTTGRPRNSPEFIIGLVGGARATGHWVEFGTQKHSVKAGASIRRGIHVGEAPMHPGNPARPFFEPAYQAKGDLARETIMKDLVLQVERKAAQLYKRTRR